MIHHPPPPPPHMINVYTLAANHCLDLLNIIIMYLLYLFQEFIGNRLIKFHLQMAAGYRYVTTLTSQTRHATMTS